ncbi:MAG: glycosyltransferase family 39 protein [Desulfurobacteriaceae bacterium]
MLRITDFSLKRLSILALIISSTIFLSRLYEPSLSGDSVKYALIGKTMLKEGNFLFPHLGEEPYYKKPPLFFWLIATSFKVFGFNEFAARLPSALFGILSSLLLFLLSYRITEDKLVSFLTATIFTLNFEVIRVTTVVRFESSLLLVNLLTLLLLTDVNLKRSILAGIISGLGALIKGPFGLLGLSAALLYYAITEKEKLKLILISLLLALLIPSIYFIYAWSQHPQFIKEFFENQIFGRITGELKEGTPRSFFFYERLILKHFWPWNLLLIPSVYFLIKGKIKVQNRKPFLLFLTMFLLTYIPLHLISLKFTRYSYYLYPFLSFLAANGAIKLRLQELALKAVALITLTYTLIALSCPCKFHKDKMKDLRPLTEVAMENFTPLGIDRKIPPITRYQLLFYFDNWSKKAKFLISNECGGKTLLKFGNYCVKESYAGSSGNYGQRLERRD